MTPFEDFIYTEPEGPYTAWLETTSEKRDFEGWLAANIHHFAASRVRDRSVSVLDVGCGWGSTSFRIIRVLQGIGLRVSYTAVDPYKAQLDKFRRLADESGLENVRLVEGTAEDDLPQGDFDLVIGSHMLYYTRDMQRAIENVVNAGREVVLVHHGPRGINTVHERFPDYVHGGPHVISTDDEVARRLESVDLRGRVLTRQGFPSTVDVSSCADPASVRGMNLIRFFVEHSVVDAERMEEVRRFLVETYAPSYTMTHDVGIFTLTQPHAPV